MECPICFDNTASCKLVCGHVFCTSCVKEWYTSSTECTCPMCRRGMYFRGMYKQRNEWEDEYNEKKIQDVFKTCYDDIIEDMIESCPPTFIMIELFDMEDRFNKLKERVELEDLEYFITETYYTCESSRRDIVHDDIHIDKSMYRVVNNRRKRSKISQTSPIDCHFLIHD